ncbi:MAG: UvrD-helicase domain-containing protein [Patescibacteria group bacterium]|jgi:DNA helicase-2/ATP-dependent DNA helicase PcrA
MPLLPTLNPAQKQAITHTAGPLLIVAGAGTGKTTVVTQRIAWLITEQKVKPDHILALTFTDKAAGEMEERVDKLLPMGYVDLWVSTFHSYCERVLRDHALDIGLSPDFTLLDETDQAILMRENLEKFELNYYRPLGNPTKFVTSLISHFSRCKDEAIRPEEYLKFAEKVKLDLDQVHGRKKKSEDDAAQIVEAERINEVANAYHTYQQLLFEKSCLDFGDLITQTLYLFQQRPKILQRYQEQFQYVLVDEFQDTNWAQYELVKMLAAPKNNLTVVGDDDQSIYKFRGASVANILAFKKDYPKAKEVVLTENYRSTQNILDLAYKFIQHNNPNRLEVQMQSRKAVSRRAVSSEGKKGQGISKKLVAQSEDTGEIGVWQMPTLEQEASAVVEKIIELKKKNAESSYNDFAVLVRANDHATPFLQRLKAANVPFQFLASAGLYRQPIILDILNYLKLLDNYHETASLYRILTLPLLAIPLPDVMHMLAVAKRETKSLFDITKQARALTSLQPATIASVEILHGWLEAHSQLARTQPVGEVTLKFLEDSGMLQQITGTTDA